MCPHEIRKNYMHLPTLCEGILSIPIIIFLWILATFSSLKTGFLVIFQGKNKLDERLGDRLGEKLGKKLGENKEKSPSNHHDVYVD